MGYWDSKKGLIWWSWDFVFSVILSLFFCSLLLSQFVSLFFLERWILCAVFFLFHTVFSGAFATPKMNSIHTQKEKRDSNCHWNFDKSTKRRYREKRKKSPISAIKFHDIPRISVVVNVFSINFSLCSCVTFAVICCPIVGWIALQILSTFWCKSTNMPSIDRNDV